VIVMVERRLKFNEAVELYRDRFQIGGGEAEGAVWQAIASREVHCAWTETAIINQERQAPRAVGNNFDIRHAADRAAAHERVKARWRLLMEVTSPAFKDEVMAGNIVLTETDLLSWYSRERVPATTPPTPVLRTSRKQIRAIMKRYRQELPAGTNPSMDDAVQFAEDNGVTGHREEVRDVYRVLFDQPRVGRPPKLNPPK
jgi:hypothetical protein